MNIDQAFDEFIEFPEGSSGNLVTTVSAKLFAKYCVEQMQEENERLLFANRYNADMYRQIDDERKRLQAEAERLRLAHSHATSQLNEANEHKQQLRASLDQAEAEVRRSRLDERQAMTYLSQVRIAAEHEGDFPSLVEHVKQMAEALRAAHEMTKAAWIEGSDAGWKAARGEADDA